MKNIVLLFTLSLALGLSACNKGDKKAQLEDLKKQASELNDKIAVLEKEIGGKDSVALKEKQVSVMDLSKQNFTHYIEVNGRVESDENITIGARSSGYITKVSAIRGQKVSKGQVLATIDAALTLRGIDELKSSLSLATTLFEKQQKLWNQQIGTEVQYLQAKNNKENLERKLSSLNEQYEQSLIKSTIDGTVDDVFIKEGENIAPGTAAFRVVSGKDYKVTAEIPEAYMSRISGNNEVEILLPDLHNKTLQSKISNVSNVIGASNRTFKIEIGLKDIKDLKANMLAYVKIKDYAKPDAVVVPINVIQHSETGDYLFVAEGKKAKKKAVKEGHTYKSAAEITEGLQPGEKIITVGYLELTDGQDITY